jgi:2'-hydroxyisoflavone reductase
MERKVDRSGRANHRESIEGCVKILVIGGTRFMGFFLTEQLLKSGHQLTLLHRGNSAPDGMPYVRNIVGDRESSLREADDDYDVVIDTSGMLPRQVRLSAAQFARTWYVYISTVSVYSDPLPPFSDESAQRCASGDPNADSVTSETYGALKAACEDVVLDGFGDSALIVRPGLMVGPRDYSDRFTYWVRRLSAAGDVLAPGGPDGPTQVIDARDLASWIARMVERREGGVYNAAGPELRFGEFLMQCARQSGVSSRLHWIGEKALAFAGVSANDAPLWIPEGDAGWAAISSQKARGYGLSCRPIAETIADTLQWDRQRGSPSLKCGLTQERERELLNTFAITPQSTAGIM